MKIGLFEYREVEKKMEYAQDIVQGEMVWRHWWKKNEAIFWVYPTKFNQFNKQVLIPQKKS